MNFDTRAGTRGRRRPGKATAWFNKLFIGRIRKGRTVMGMNALVLTTIGRKSGLERQTPVGWFPGDDGTWLIVASAAGAASNPAWFHNLAAHPDQVWIELGGDKIAVRADQLHDQVRAAAWQRITTAAPRFASYQEATDRELPVIHLTRR